MCLNARTIHLSTKHQLFQNNAEHVFNTCITNQLFEIFNLILKVIQTFTITFIQLKNFII